MFRLNYILDGHIPKVEDDICLWGLWMASADRHVASTEVYRAGIDHKVYISTVFLGIDHSFDGPPMLFETMIFVPEGHPLHSRDQECWRYATWDEAQSNHRAIVASITNVETTIPQDTD